MSSYPAGSTQEPGVRRPGLIETGVAIRVARRLATDPMEGSYLVQDLARSFSDLVAEAEPLVAEEAGFGPPTPARARVLSRSEWAEANIASTVKLLSPLLEKVEAKVPVAAEGSPGALARKAYGSFLGAQLGGVLGFVSQRVLGQYELDQANASDVWFVGPNVVITERRFGFVPRDFRLWVAVHELTHRAQFEGNPWLRGYFHGSVGELLASLELQPIPLLERAIKAVRSPEGADPIGIRLLDPHQREIFDRLQALMSTVEGHGNFVMDRVGAERIPTQPRMRRTLSGSSMDGPLGKILRRLLGLDLKKLQYEEGQRFFDAVFAAAGRDGVRAAFAGASSLPSLGELREPGSWLARVHP
ncbi:MAG TPA: zinc-dependent metalloprotease [Actinomycetota bacterium]|nr:zinc-dependent metalloprotease [Actinomycetota bacterium]